MLVVKMETGEPLCEFLFRPPISLSHGMSPPWARQSIVIARKEAEQWTNRL